MENNLIENNRIFSKVFMWLFVGIFLSFGVAYYVSTNENMIYNIFSTSKYYFIILAEFVLVIFLSARTRKMSYLSAIISYLLYSFVSGLTLSIFFVVFQISSILSIFALTAIILLVFGLIGMFTKIDLTKFGTYLLMALFGVVLAMIVNFFFKSETFDLAITIVGLILFIIYIAYDVQKIKKNLYMVENENCLAIIGALDLYLDFINIFIKLLTLFGKRND